MTTDYNGTLPYGHPINTVSLLLWPLIFVPEKCKDNTFSYKDNLLIQPTPLKQPNFFGLSLAVLMVPLYNSGSGCILTLNHINY
jgi:hypothetical protein